VGAFTIPSIFTAIDKLTQPLAVMGKNVEAFAAKTQRAARMAGDIAKKVAVGAGIAAAVIAAPLAVAANDAIQFQDRMADVAKTTGLSGSALDKYGGQLLDMSGTTRSSIEDLIKIGEIGGQLGIAQEDLIGFTGAVDKFNVALGSDFAGGVEEAASQIGKIKTLFAQTKELNIADAITKTGSAINELGAVGAATSSNIAEFTLRMGQLPGALKPTITDSLALGTFLEEVGLSAEIGSGGLTRFLLVAGSDIGKFAGVMKVSAASAKALLNTNPTEFAKKFALSVKDLSATDLAKTLGDLGVGTQESIKVIGALGTGIDRVNQLQEISNKAFSEGTSLLVEFGKKNETVAAKIARGQNNMKAFSIQLGTELLPLISEFLGKVIPLIKGFSDWAKANPQLFKTLIFVGVGLAGLLGLLSVVATAVAGVSAAIGIFNALLLLSPIGWITLAVIGLVAAVGAAVLFWDKWGASLAVLLGPLGLVVSLIESFIRNWGMITKAFKEDGIIAGLKAIGKTIFDALLMPMQQFFSLLSKIPGLPFGDQFGKMAANIQAYRESSGVTMAEDAPAPVVNPEAVKQESMTSQIMNMKQSAELNVNVNDPNGRATVSGNGDFLRTIKTTSTMPAY
jgi:TP901 family phage tail tape measure protein